MEGRAFKIFWRKTWRAGLLALIGLAVYFPCLGGGWIWDDTVEIPQNAAIHGSLRALAGVWFFPKETDYFPLKTTVQWIEWHLWGDHPVGYHLLSVALHILSACLVWRILRRMKVRLAWWGGLLFLIHPLAVESVAWISELKNTLSLPLLLLAWDAYLRADEDEQSGRAQGLGRGRLISLGYFTASLLAKTAGVMLPFCFLLHARWKRGRTCRRDWLSACPYFAVALALGVVTVFFQEGRAYGANDVDIGSLGFRLVEAGGHLFFYLGAFLWPFPRYPLYGHDPVGVLSVSNLWPWPVLALGVFWLFSGRGPVPRAIQFGLGWFVLNLLPVLGVIPMAYQKFAWVADRFAYVPLLGLVGLTVAGAAVAGDWLSLRSPYLCRAAAGVAIGVLALLAVGTSGQAFCFRSPEQLWSWVVLHNPQGWAGHYNLGIALEEWPGREAAAVEQFEAAIRLNPRFVGAHNNLANLFARMAGKQADAEAEYRTVLRLKPDYAEAENNLANLLSHQPGRKEEAEEHYRRALRLWPSFAQAHSNYGNFLGRIPGREAEAEGHLEAAIRADPGYEPAQLSLALLLDRDPSRRAEALGHYEAAVRLKPSDAEAHLDFGVALAAMPGRASEAEAQYRQAMAARPAAYAEAHNDLGVLLATLPGRQAEALAEYETAVRIDPNFAQAQANLAFELARDPSRVSQALSHYEAAIRLDPGNAVTQNNLANLLATIPGREQEALAHYRQALAANPDYAEAHNNLANVLAKDPATLAQAVSEYETAVRLAPRFAEAHFNLGVALANLGRTEEAVREFQTALEIRPDFQAARDDLNQLLGPGRGSP